MSKVDKKKIKKQKKIIRNIGIVFSLILIISSIVFDIFVGGVNVLPNKYFLPLVLISNLFIILFSIVLIKPKFRIWFKVIIMLMGMFMCIIFWIGRKRSCRLSDNGGFVFCPAAKHIFASGIAAAFFIV